MSNANLNHLNQPASFQANVLLAMLIFVGLLGALGLIHFEADATRDTIRAHGFLSERVREQAACEDCHCHCDACKCCPHKQPPQPPKPHGDAGPSGSKPPASGAAAP